MEPIHAEAAVIQTTSSVHLNSFQLLKNFGVQFKSGKKQVQVDSFCLHYSIHFLATDSLEGGLPWMAMPRTSHSLVKSTDSSMGQALWALHTAVGEMQTECLYNMSSTFYKKTKRSLACYAEPVGATYR